MSRPTLSDGIGSYFTVDRLLAGESVERHAFGFLIEGARGGKAWRARGDGL